MGFHIIDATLSIEEQQGRMREILQDVLGQSLETDVLRGPAGGEMNGYPAAAPVL
jgi:hypothetical protein